MTEIKILTALWLVAASPLLAQNFAVSDSQSFQAGAQSFQAKEAGKGDSDYQKGLSALDAANWEQAIGFFEASASHKGSHVDASLYWLAFAQHHAGERDSSLATIRQLRQSYASSRWLNDAKALEVEIQGQDGESPASPSNQSDEELKLLALNSLMASDPEKAIPILQKLLTGNSSDKIKERALFVLVQNPSPDARKMIDDMARGASHSELQMKAIRYLGMMGGKDASAELASIYKASSNQDVKKAILQSFMVSGSKSLLVDVARSESNPDLRRDAIHQLAVSGGRNELWQLYQQETSIENKKAILQSLFITGDSEKLADVARNSTDRELKVAAIKSLGIMGNKGRGDLLISIYQSDTDDGVRRAVLQALFLQQNGKALVELARAEKDPHMKEEIVKKMSLVHSKEVTDYMMEILK